ncbi:MAG: heavy metal sensor histidine kinase [Rhodocyclales bacterium]|nr:heavy metal sensor histidine kinase [Rhodocyclales bacterium]
MTSRKSITARLTLLFAAVSIAVLLGLGFLVGASVERHFEEQDMDVLRGKLDLTRHALAELRSPADLATLPQRLEAALIGHHGLAVVIVGARGTIVFSNADAPFPEPLLSHRLAAPSPPLVWVSGGTSYRGIAAAVPTGMADWPEATVAVATDISHHEEFMASFQLTLWSFVLVAALLSGLLGWAAVRRGLAPLREIGRAAATVTASRLDYRLPAGSIPAELAELAETLNQMLARLEDSFRRISDFSSDLAHELRTPVSNLMTATQVALSKARTADEYREALASNVEEFERLARMIADMLFLAKADHGLVVPNRESVDLAQNVRELFLFYEALAEEKGVGLELSGEAMIVGDHLMLRRALSNLLANAIRHTHRGGRVAVQIDAPRGDSVWLTVENTGDAISPEHLPRLFDRFFRADPSRQHASDGAGLGLAITDSIIRAHGGDIEVHSADSLTRFRLRLPAHHAPDGIDGSAATLRLP